MLIKLIKKQTIITVIIGIIVVMSFLLIKQTSNKDFNSEKWKNWTETEAELSLRWDMINDLKYQYELKGQTKLQIIDLLGEPEQKSKTHFYYYLGASRRGIDIGTLIIVFNNKGIVKDFFVEEG